MNLYKNTFFIILLSISIKNSQAAQEVESYDLVPKDLSETQLNESNMCKGKLQKFCNKRNRLSAYKPNTAAWEFTEDDDNSLEVNYSFKYLLTRPDCSVEKRGEQFECISRWNDRNEVFLSYTGKFDFYMNTRPSSPVVNRVNNPALHWRFHNPSFMGWADWLSLALEHRSNGQTTEYDLKDSNGNFIAEQRWRTGDRAYIDGISRSANFISAEIKDSFEYGSTKISYWISGKVYSKDDESRVSWGEQRNSDARIWDYDVARLVFSGTTNMPDNSNFKQFEYSLEYTAGMKGLSTDSLNATVYFPYDFGNRIYFPINFLKVHVGPMNELSNYTESQTSIFLGISLKG